MEEKEKEKEKEKANVISTSELELKQKATDVLDKFTLAHAGSRLAVKRFGESMKELQEVQDEGDGKEFVKYANGLLKQDKTKFKEIEKLLEDFKSATGQEMKMHILKVYRAVFKNIRHRTLKLEAKTGNGYIVSVGPYGFGIVYSVQAKPVRYFEDMAEITKCSPQICRSLRDYGGRLKKWAEVLEKFVELTPDLEAVSSTSITVALEKPVLLSKKFNWNSTSPPCMSEKVKVGKDKDIIFEFQHKTWDEDEYKWSDSEDGTSFYWEKISEFSEAVIYLQVKDDIPRILEKVRETVIPNVEKSQETIAKLQEVFGRELLFEEI